MSQEWEEGTGSYQGRSLKLRVTKSEKSAEVIVVDSNEPLKKNGGLTVERRTER